MINKSRRTPKTAEAWQLRDETMDPRNFDLRSAMTPEELRHRLARILGAATMWSITFGMLRLFNEFHGRNQVEGQRLDYDVQTGGRIRAPEFPFLGSHGDDEAWYRLYDQPYIGEALFMMQAGSGERVLTEYLNDRVSLGYLANALILAMGYRDDFNRNLEPGVIAANELSSFIPFQGDIRLLRRLVDPVRRDPDNFGETILDQFPGTSRALPPRIGRQTGQPSEYDRRQELIKWLFLNIKTVDREEREEAEAEAVEQAVRELINQARSAETQAMRNRLMWEAQDIRARNQ